MTLFDWPRAAAFGRVIPKNKIYEHAGAKSALKDAFVRDVDQIVWAYKLAPETVNLAATKAVAEIQVFRIVQKQAELDRDVLRAIDRAIPFPLIFELAHGERIKLVAAYKRPSEFSGGRWVLGDYFESAWTDNASRAAMPVALDLGALYEQLLNPLVAGQSALAAPGGMDEASAPYVVGVEPTPMPLEARIALAEAIKAKAREVERITGRLAREKQFNRRVAINAELREATEALRKMREGDHGEAE